MTKVRYKEARERRGLSLEEVAGFAGVTPWLLVEIEAGRAKAREMVQRRLENLLRFPGWWLQGHDDGPREMIEELRARIEEEAQT